MVVTEVTPRYPPRATREPVIDTNNEDVVEDLVESMAEDADDDVLDDSEFDIDEALEPEEVPPHVWKAKSSRCY